MSLLPGSPGSSGAWQQNEAHGGLYGVYMNKDGLAGCSLVRRFTVWKSYDYGIYIQVGVGALWWACGQCTRVLPFSLLSFSAFSCSYV